MSNSTFSTQLCVKFDIFNIVFVEKGYSSDMINPECQRRRVESGGKQICACERVGEASRKEEPHQNKFQDGRTDRRTDTPSYRDAWTHLKRRGG